MSYPGYVVTDEWTELEEELFDCVREFAISHKLQLKESIMLLAGVLRSLVSLSSEAYEGFMENAK